MFTAGWAILAGGSLVAGLADTTGVEIAARAAQGAGAALIAPSALTLLMMLFGSNPKELMKAFAVYGAAAPAGGTAGVFLGGVITEWISWPWVFYVNIPIAIGVLARDPRRCCRGARPPRLDRHRRRAHRHRRPRADRLRRRPRAGGGLGLAADAAVASPAGSRCWPSSSPSRRARREPLMRLGILRTPNLAAANLAQLLLGAAWIPMWFFLNLYLQQVLGYGAFEGGAALLPMTAAIMVLMVVVAPRVDRPASASRRRSSPACCSRHRHGRSSRSSAPDGSFVVDVLPASLIAAAGMALAFIPSLGTAISRPSPRRAAWPRASSTPATRSAPRSAWPP